ncbi:MAG TPA: SDR family oxidoreductase [Puia sp.]|jgi:short-subunit dehydrogenase|nr:SDR family oxidoreductase [Puia sp.]
MRYDFTDKVIWITGASSGIGEALAYALSVKGSRLILSSRRVEELERVRRASAHPDKVKVIPLDLLEPASFEVKTAEAITAFGQVDVVVHNGGISQRGLAAETSIDVQRRVMELDYFSYIALTQAVLPHFTQRKTGRFVVMSSVMGKIGTPMRSAYAAAKHALHGYFDCLRAEVSSIGIGVTILTPGYIRTNISQYAVTKDGSPMGKASVNIQKGLAADKAAAQILRVIGRGKYEAYIGKMGPERMALWVNRWFPGMLIRMAPGLIPK